MNKVAITYCPSTFASTIPPNSNRSPLLTKKPRIDERKIHLPKLTISVEAAGSHSRLFGTPGNHVWLRIVLATEAMIPPATRHQIDRSKMIQHIIQVSPMICEAISTRVTSPSVRPRLASNNFVDSKPATIAESDKTQITGGRTGAA